MAKTDELDAAKIINTAQLGGIDAYTIDEGPARGVRALCINTGGGLRFRVLADRGLDIDQAFFNQHSLTCLLHKGLTAPTRGLDRGLDWLRGFPGGLLTSCGPFNVGNPCTDNGEELGLHGEHSNTTATLESVVQPDARAGKFEMSITGSLRYGKLHGPSLELRRTIRCQLFSNRIDFVDEFFNPGNRDVPHAWLLHINFGYPLMDEGAEFCYEAVKFAPIGTPESRERFKPGVDFKKIPAPIDAHKGSGSYVGYLYPKMTGRNGQTTVGIVNRKLPLGLAIHYGTREFPRCTNWQHFGRYEYISALEPCNCGVEGRDKDRQRGWLETLRAGARKTYQYSIEVLSDKEGIDAMRKLNAK